MSESTEINAVSTPQPGDIIIDIRHPAEREAAPLTQISNRCLLIPFFDLLPQLANLDPNQKYLLYCKQGIMGKLQVHAMRKQGFKNVAVLKLDD